MKALQEREPNERMRFRSVERQPRQTTQAVDIPADRRPDLDRRPVHFERVFLGLVAADRGAVRGRNPRAVRRPQHVLGGRHIVHIGQQPGRAAHVEVRRDKRGLHRQLAARHRAGRVLERRPGVLRRVRGADRVELDRPRGRPLFGSGQFRAVRQERRVAEVETFLPKLSERVPKRNPSVYRHVDSVAVVPSCIGGKNRRQVQSNTIHTITQKQFGYTTAHKLEVDMFYFESAKHLFFRFILFRL